MNSPISASKIVLVADRTREAASGTGTIRRYRLARVSADRRPGGRASARSLRPA